MSLRVLDPIAEARSWLFVRETLGPNRGVFVEAIQRVTDNKPGESWCMSMLSTWLWRCYQGPAPLPRTGSCDVAFAVAKKNGWIVKTPAPGDVFFRVKPDGDAHHVGFVTAVYPDRVGTIAGNTSEDGKSSNGTGVFEHDQKYDSQMVFVRLPLNTESVK